MSGPYLPIALFAASVALACLAVLVGWAVAWLGRRRRARRSFEALAEAQRDREHALARSVPSR